MSEINLLWVPVAVFAIFLGAFLIDLLRKMYIIVPPSEAHLVITPKERLVVSSDDAISIPKGTKTYFNFPPWIPIIGKNVRKLSVTIAEVIVEQETYEKQQGRYQVSSSTKYRIFDIQKAGETFINTESLERQLEEIIKSSVRAVTVQFNVNDVRSDKTKMEEAIRHEMEDDFSAWGLTLVNFQLVDFSDTEDSTIISAISEGRESEIVSKTRIEVAERNRGAREAEASADEKARTREILRDQVVGERSQEMEQAVSEKEKDAQEKAYDVIQVQTVRKAEIEKEAAVVEANQNKEVEKIKKETKQLDGEGEQLKLQAIAIGEAAKTKETYLAEAEGKEKLQEALNKFSPQAITALTAELVVDKDKTIGIAIAKALQSAHLKVFSGGQAGQQGFNLAQLLESTNFSNPDMAQALKNVMAKPHDLGFGDIAKLNPEQIHNIEHILAQLKKAHPEKVPEETSEKTETPQEEKDIRVHPKKPTDE